MSEDVNSVDNVVEFEDSPVGLGKGLSPSDGLDTILEENKFFLKLKWDLNGDAEQSKGLKKAMKDKLMVANKGKFLIDCKKSQTKP